MKQLLLLFFIPLVVGKAFSQNESRYSQVFDSVVAKNDQKNGIVFFEAELKKHPKNELILRCLGALNLQLLNFKQTIFYYEKALAVNPECAKCYFFVAEALANENNLDAAYQKIEKGLSVNSKEGILYLLRGKLKLSQGNEIAGLNDLSKAILVDPDGMAYYLERAEYFLKKGNYFSAKRDLLKAQELDPKNLLVYNYLAQVYSYDNDFTNALNSINKALEIDPANVESLLTRGEVYFMKADYVSAIENYQRVVQLNPGHYDGYHYLANAYYKLEKMDDFCVSISRSIELMEEQKIDDPAYYQDAVNMRNNVCDSTLSSYYYQRGIALFNLNHPKEAIDIYNRGIAKFPNEYMTYSFRGNAQLSLLNNREAIADYLKSLNHIDQVALEMSKGSNFSSAKDSLQLVAAGFKSSTYLSLAFCYFNLENTDSALWCIDQSILFQPNLKEFDVADAPFMKGILLLDKHNYSEAEKSFRKAATLSPDWSICNDYIALSLVAQAKPTSVLRNKLQIKSLLDLESLHWTLPSKVSKPSPYLNQALEYVNTSIRLNASDYFAVYLRGYIKRQLRMEYCDDFLKANQLGYPVELDYLKECR